MRTFCVWLVVMSLASAVLASPPSAPSPEEVKEPTVTVPDAPTWKAKTPDLVQIQCPPLGRWGSPPPRRPTLRVTGGIPTPATPTPEMKAMNQYMTLAKEIRKLSYAQSTLSVYGRVPPQSWSVRVCIDADAPRDYMNEIGKILSRLGEMPFQISTHQHGTETYLPGATTYVPALPARTMPSTEMDNGDRRGNDRGVLGPRDDPPDKVGTGIGGEEGTGARRAVTVPGGRDAAYELIPTPPPTP